jgi:TonB family protein
MTEGIRRCSRTKMVLPLRVWLDEQEGETSPVQWAHTIEISDLGCRLGGLRTELSVGQTITLQRGQKKASFRVVWAKHLAATENQAGIEAVESGVNIWSLNLPASAEAADSPAAAPAARTSVGHAAVAKKPSSPTRQEQKATPARARRGWRWSFGLASLSLGMALGTFLLYQSFYQPGMGSLASLAPVPPTADDLARLTPKTHPMPASLSRPLEASASRLRVAEAPTGHVVYPVAPDESISGKVRLQIVIAANGLVKQIHVLSGKQPLAEAAAQAVRLWHYGSLAGTDQATERETTVTVSFVGGDTVSLEFPSANGNSRRARND